MESHACDHPFTWHGETAAAAVALGPPYPSMPQNGPQEFLTIQ